MGGSSTVALREPTETQDPTGATVVRRTRDSGGYIDSGSLYLYGLNSFGEISPSGTVRVPTLYAGLSGVTDFDMDALLTCAVSDALYCWGYNVAGQLGLGDTTNRATATAVALPGTAARVRVSAFRTCASNLAGELYCFGNRVGDGTTDAVSTPFKALDGPVTAFDTGHLHACGVVGGDLYCWGDNAAGQLGTGDTVAQLTPTLVPGLGTVTSVATESEITLAVSDGDVYAFGNGGYGLHGAGPVAGELSPVRVPGLSGVVAVAIGNVPSSEDPVTACALTNGDALYCWGVDSHFALGLGRRSVEPSPARVVYWPPTSP